MINRRLVSLFGRVALLGALALSLSAASSVTIEQAQVTYAIDETALSTTASIPTLKNTEIGTCICDLTVARCDLNCACDPDCTAAEVARFTSTANPGPPATSVVKCVDPEVVRVNARGSLTASAVNNLLCIAQDNSPSKGYFLTSPTSLSAAEIATLEANNPYSYAAASSSTTTSSSSSSTAGAAYATSQPLGLALYDAGDPSTLATASVTALWLPSSGLSGLCSDANPVRYGVDVASSSCTRSSTATSPSDVAAACVAGGPFDANNYLNINAMVATRASAATTSPSLYVPLFLNTATYEVAGAAPTTLYNRTAQFPALNATTVYTTASSNASLFAFPVPTWTAATCTCDNVLTGAWHRIAYDAAGYVVAVNTDARLGRATAWADAAQTSCATQLSYAQEWGAAFVSRAAYPAYMTAASTAASASAAAAATASAQRPRSGNPGYLSGYPVLAGVGAAVNGSATTNAVRQSVAGLTVLGYDAAGACQSVTAPASPSATYTNVVGFGVDGMWSCSLSLTLAQLQTLCASATGLGDYLAVSATHLGMWGNSSAAAIADWVALSAATYPTTAAGTMSGRTCSGLLDTLDVDVAFASFGSVPNPQRAVISAKTEYSSSGAWVFTNTNPAVAQSFQVRAAVRFLEASASAVTQHVPGAPPIIPRLPADFLYPFYVGRSAAGPAAVASAGLVLALGVASALVAAAVGA